jgi:transposase
VAPVPAPQTPHPLPSPLLPPENCCAPVPFRILSPTSSALAMRDITFFSKLLALENPWRVERVSLDTQKHHIDVWLAHRRNASFACPECGRPSPLRDHVSARSWRHLDHGDCLTWLHTNLPRVACPVHGIRRVRVPWALPGSRFTIAFERHAIDVLLQADVLGGAGLLHISWDEAWNIMERAVARGLRAKKRRVIAHLGVDEKAVAKRHRYVTLVCDLDRSTVEYIGDDRKQTSLDAYYQSLSRKQLAGIKAVAMDMWEPFVASTVAHVPDGASKIVFDRFHVMKHMLEAVDEVRKWEHGLLHAEGDETLKGTKYLWLFSEENLPEPSRERFAALRALHLKTGRAWAIKESLRDLWAYRRKGWALRHWKRWYFWATHSRLKPVVKVARMIQRHLDNVMTYFDHRITNATSEGLNSKIQTIKKTLMVSAIGIT